MGLVRSRFSSDWRVIVVAAAFVALYQGVASACDERIYGSCEARASQWQAPFAKRSEGSRRDARASQRHAPFAHRSEGSRRDARRPAEPKRAPRQKPPPPPAAIATDEPGVTVPVMAMTEQDRGAREPATEPASTDAASFVRTASSAAPTIAGPIPQTFPPPPPRISTDTGSSMRMLLMIGFVGAGLISLILAMAADGVKRVGRTS